MSDLNNIRVVLVRTFHPGNIGSAARAMKTMGLKDLYLVNPIDFPSDEAIKMSASADDVVSNAMVVESLYEALHECSVVVASTARPRGYDLPELNPEQSAKALNEGSITGKVALVFGPERMGLSNEDLQLAKYRVSIPTHPEYSSLNLAAAVQTLCYEVYKEYSVRNSPSSDDYSNTTEAFEKELPTTEDVERFYDHLESTLNTTGFINKSHPGEIMQKFRNLFGRSQPDTSEINILRGVLSSVQKFSNK